MKIERRIIDFKTLSPGEGFEDEQGRVYVKLQTGVWFEKKSVDAVRLSDGCVGKVKGVIYATSARLVK